MNTSMFPEIAKAVSHKYLKRVHRPGGGFRYVYAEEKVVSTANVRGENISASTASVRLNGHLQTVDREIRGQRFKEALKVVDKMEDIVSAFRGVKGIDVIPWERKIGSLRWKIQEAKEKAAAIRRQQTESILSRARNRPEKPVGEKYKVTPGDTMVEAISLTSPSGKMSKRARKAAEARFRLALWGKEGMPEPKGPPPPSKREKLLWDAKMLRGLAARGMDTKRLNRQAEQLEKQAAALKN